MTGMEVLHAMPYSCLCPALVHGLQLPSMVGISNKASLPTAMPAGTAWGSSAPPSTC